MSIDAIQGEMAKATSRASSLDRRDEATDESINTFLATVAVDHYDHAFSTPASSKTNVQIQGERTHSKRPFLEKVLTPDEIRREFTKRPCCDKACILRDFKMPLDPYTQQCTLGRGDSSMCICCADPLVCLPTSSASNTTHARQERQQKESSFDEFVNSVREASSYWRNDDKTWTDFLVEHFRGKYTKAPSGKYRWIYSLVHPHHGQIVCCRSAYMAIMGVSYNKLEYVQSLVKAGIAGMTSDRFSENRRSRPMTQSEIFRLFNLDIEVFRDNIRNWCDFSAVGDSTKSLVATAWLCDYIDLDGDEQVKQFFFAPLVYQEYSLETPMLR
jgi:hypothetical protein